MYRVSRHVVCLVSFSLILNVISGFAQQRRRVAAPIAQTKPAVASPANKTAMPLKKVVLYSNGVGYFERQGGVAGDANVTLQFTPEEMDDVLKSLVILDRDKGRISTVSFDTAKPLDVALSEFAFDLGGEKEAGSGISKLLASFRGARVEVREGSTSFVGNIVGVEKHDQAQGDGKGASYWLAVLSENGEARTFQLSQSISVRLLDGALKEDIAHYLNLLGTAHRKDGKTIVINCTGEGTRQLSVSYTIAAPVWKTTYRAVIDNKGQPLLQGWAVVDNVQDEDWRDVDLSLVSGTPISFIQNLKQPLYRHRPVLGLDEAFQATPQRHEAELRVKSSTDDDQDKSTVEAKDRKQGSAAKSNKIEARQISELPFAARNNIGLVSFDRDKTGTDAETTTESIGELFQYHISHPVTIGKNQSALIPIVQASIEGEAVSIFNEESRIANPMSGLMLKNTTGLTLEGGPITVIERDSYAGEAVIDRMKPGETRFVGYAVDLGVRASTKFGSDRQTVTKIQIVDDTLAMSIKSVDTKTYKFSNISDTTKTIIVEHPHRVGYKLIGPAQPYITTDKYYRFRAEVKPNSTVEIVVTEEQPVVESFEISDPPADRVSFLLRQQYISPEIKQKLAFVLEKKSKVETLETAIKSKEKIVETILSDQQRLRENIKALGQSVDERKLVGRYVAKLEEDETTIGKLRTEITEVEESKSKIEEEIASILKSLVTG